MLKNDSEDDYAPCYGPLVHLINSGDPQHTFLMAGYDDLDSGTYGSFGYKIESDRVIFYWDTETRADAKENLLNRFQIILYSDGRVQWNRESVVSPHRAAGYLPR